MFFIIIIIIIRLGLIYHVGKKINEINNID